jgi:hypothetical protein
LQALSRILDVDATFVSLQKIRDWTTRRPCANVAHLAAALCRPTWLMLAYRPDFRWLLDREDSPWDPTMRLFRQTTTRMWPDRFGRNCRS